jgi:hypothetical protein
MTWVRPAKSAQRSGVSPRKHVSESASSKSGIEYRVSFDAVQIITGRDIRDAVRQAKQLGATEIVGGHEISALSHFPC